MPISAQKASHLFLLGLQSPREDLILTGSGPRVRASCAKKIHALARDMPQSIQSETAACNAMSCNII